MTAVETTITAVYQGMLGIHDPGATSQRFVAIYTVIVYFIMANHVQKLLKKE
ncbi:MAG: hypothetical protein ACFFCS_25115 [Candidatus Hodarchaeota archaeon]